MITIDSSVRLIRLSVLETAPYPVIIGRDTLKGWLLVEQAALMMTEEHTEEHTEEEEDEENVVTFRTDINTMSATTAAKAEIDKDVWSLLEDLPSVWRQELDEIGCTKGEAMKIKLVEGARPHRRQAYKRNPADRELIEEEIRAMLKKDIIEESRSEFAAPVVLVKKKGTSKKRFCVDYTALNNDTIMEHVDLPAIEEIRDRMEGCSYFSKIDLLKGYWQLRLAEESRDFTAFVTHMGQYRFKRVSMGLRCACQHFQKTLRSILAGTENFCDNHVDDILIFSKTQQEHLQHLKIILKLLDSANLILSLAKCEFMKREVTWCGQRFSREGVGPDPEKIAAIQRIDYPKDAKEVRSFVQLCNYYRAHIHNFAEKTHGLIDLTKEGTAWCFTEEHKKAWNLLKTNLASNPVMANPDYTKEFVLHTDACLYGIGATLSQYDEAGHLHPVAYYSKMLNKHQRNYPIVELECLAITKAVDHWEQYLSYRAFSVYTDHKPLTWINLTSTKNSPNKRIQRWVMKLSEYDFKAEYVKGEHNAAADTLSRLLPVSGDVRVRTEELMLVSASSLEEDVTTDDIIKSRTYWNYLVDNATLEEAGDLPMTKRMRSRIARLAVDMRVEDLEMYKGSRRVPWSLEERQDIVEKTHLIGHFGAEATTTRILQEYWWPNVYLEVKEHINNCRECVMFNDRSLGTRLTATETPLPPVAHPFQVVGVDYVGPFPKSKSGKTGIFVFSDHFTDYAFAFPVSEKTGAQAAIGYLEVISTVGPADILLSDQGKEFLNSMVGALCEKFETTRKITSGYHPTTNGTTEKHNHILCTALRKLCAGVVNDWDEWLPWVLYADRTRKRGDSGHSPLYLLTGRNTATFNTKEGPIEAENDLLKKLDRIRFIVEIVHPRLAAKLKKMYDKKIERVPIPETAPLPPGTFVVLMKPVDLVTKMGKRTQDGVYQVTERTTKGNYVLQAKKGSPVITPMHPSRLRIIGEAEANRRIQDIYDDPVQGEPKERQDIFEISKILEHELRGIKMFYHVQWLGTEQNSWEEASSFTDRVNLKRIKAYWTAKSSSGNRAHTPTETRN